MKTILFTLLIIFIACAWCGAGYMYQSAAHARQRAAMLDDLQRAEYKLARAERVAAAQFEFFDRFQRGYWTHLPALEACRASFCQYVEYHSAYVPDTSMTFVYSYDPDTDCEYVTVKRATK